MLMYINTNGTDCFHRRWWGGGQESTCSIRGEDLATIVSGCISSPMMSLLRVARGRQWRTIHVVVDWPGALEICPEMAILRNMTTRSVVFIVVPVDRLHTKQNSLERTIHLKSGGLEGESGSC